MANVLIHSALAWANCGIHVFPCWETKRPRTSRGLLDASIDPDQIEQWWARWPDALIGAATGSISGFVVVDVDVKDGQPGMAWLDSHRANLPTTRTHQTRSGGIHLLFLMPDRPVRNSQSRLAAGIDVRGNGGYVILPPSRGYTVANDAAPAEMPSWLVSACAPPPPPVRQALPRKPVGPDAAAGRLLALTRLVATAQNGQRNSVLFWASCRAAEAVLAGEMPSGTASAELEHAAICAGLPTTEVRQTIMSAFRSVAA